MDDGLTNSFTTAVTDGSGGNTGTLVRNDGASHWFDGSVAKLDGCLKVEGTNAFVSFPQSADLDINTNQLTISAWVWLPIVPSQLATSFGAIFDSTTDCYVLYLDRANNELRFKVTAANGHAARPGIAASFLQTNQWLHIAATYNGQAYPASGQAIIYLNGTVADSHFGNDGGAGTGLTENVKAGQVAAMGREGPTGGNYFTGFLDDVAVWRRALGPSEIQRLCTEGQRGQSLGDLLREPTPLIEFLSVRKIASSNALVIQFRNSGPWHTFRLLRSTSWNTSFQPVQGITAEPLGNNDYRFTYPLNTNAIECFRVEAQ
jgi:hypothetical protein